MLAHSCLMEAIHLANTLAKQELAVLTVPAHGNRLEGDNLLTADRTGRVVAEERHSLAEVGSLVAAMDSPAAAVDNLAVVVGSLAGQMAVVGGNQQAARHTAAEEVDGRRERVAEERHSLEVAGHMEVVDDS